jgi:3-oxoacyl-[acyl-carrier protein] reductase
VVEDKSKGVLVNMPSVSLAGNAGQTDYSSSIAAVAPMTVSWSKDLACFGICIVCIAPKLVGTAMAVILSWMMGLMFRTSETKYAELRQPIIEVTDTQPSD